MLRFLVSAILMVFVAGGANGTEPIVRSLSNGLQVAILPIPESSVVAVRVLVRTGSIDEVGSNSGSGLAHYLEHLLAGGSTRKRTESAYRDGLALMGGASNAFTTYDHTGYFINTTPENTDLAIQYLSEWMFESQINETEFRRERDVITKEMEKSEADVSRVFYEAANRFFYPDHPAGRPIIGYRPNFNSVTSDQVRTFYRANYVPNNMILVVVGNVNPSAVLKKIDNSFGKYPTKAVAISPVYNAPLPFVSRSQVVVSTSNVAYVSLRFPSVNLVHPDLNALDLLEYALGNGDRSLLLKSIVYDRKLATSITVSSYTPKFTNGYFEVTAVCQPEQVEPLKQAVFEGLNSVKSGGIEADSLESAKLQKKMDYISGSDNTNDIASQLGDSMLYSGTSDFFKVYTDRMAAVTTADVKDVANRYLDFNRVVTTVLVGKNADKNNSVSQNVSPISTPNVETLSNGVRVVFMPPDSNPRVNIRAYVTGGLRAETSELNGLGYLLSLLWGKGSRQYDRQTLETAFEGRGASMSSHFGMKSLSLEMTSLSDDVQLLLPKFADTFWNPSFDSSSFEVAKNQQKAVISQREDQWYKQAMLSVQAGFYGSYALSLPSEGTIESTSKFTKGMVVQWHDALLKPEKVVVVVSGKYQKESILTQLNQLLGSPSGSQSAFDAFRAIKYSPLTNSSVTTGSLTQSVSAVIVAMKSPTTRDLKSQVVTDTLDAVLSGMEYPGGRLSEKLRGESDGLVYMVHAQTVASPESGMFVVYAITSSDKAQRVRQIISDELDALMNLPVSENELKVAIAQQKFSYRSAINSIQSRDLVVGTGLLQDIPISYWNDRITMADAVTIENVQAMAKSLFAVRQSFLFNFPITSALLDGGESNNNLAPTSVVVPTPPIQKASSASTTNVKIKI